MSIRTLYERSLAPLSPYRGTPNMPNWSLWHRVNDDGTHGIPRIACMAVWAPIGAAMAGAPIAFMIAYFGGYYRFPGLAGFGLIIAALGMLALKVDHVEFAPHYHVDPLDWICDAACWGMAGAYTVAELLTHHPFDWRVYLALFALWLLTYPWSTPR
jgi:hypothetical protein